ncbi:MAG: Vitamin B12 dependent methionine synthase activation subunit [Ruminococcaceae bacterium]|nr:Vitamin B12 dependent methionine synthase activation subunit [Oscillospiraceae bacterium]
MKTIVYTKSYSPPPFDKRAALKYAGACGEDDRLSSLIDECFDEIAEKLSYKLCYAEFPLTRVENSLDFGFAKVTSAKLSARLSDCDRVIIFASTLGIEIDRIISRYCVSSPAKALIMQAIGAERIEALCDLFSSLQRENGLRAGLMTTERFSAGYGDLPLGFQRDVFRVLDCPRKIGLTLNGSLLMSPTKSVTAIIGIKRISK